jgi:tetratricopeptide (TPR) repeat protein
MPDVQPAFIACEVTLGDWEAVLRMTESPISAETEYLRHAYRAVALREQGNRLLSQSEWQSALAAAGRSAEALQRLTAMAADGKWVEEEEQALWAATEKLPDSEWALRRLSDHYSEAGNTEALRRVAVRMVRADPTNQDAQNDFALLSLLTLKDTEKAEHIARELYQQHPENSAYASTFAFALHVNGKSGEGLRILRNLSPSQPEDPALAVYYAIILAANHEAAEATHYLWIAKKAHLLPEEKQLLAEAAKAVSGKEVARPGPTYR